MHTNKNQQSFAVFDIDGTLIRWQLYHAVVDRLAKNNLLGPDAHQTLHQARMVWKRREHPDAYRTYEQTLIAIYEAALPQLKPAQFDQVVSEIIDEYKDQVYTYTRELITTLKKQGYILLAISGSHHELVQKIAEHYGFDDYEGTRYQRTTTNFSGGKLAPSHDKASVLKQLTNKHHLIFNGSYAVGDSTSDASMLELVDNPVAFNPDQSLYDIATKKHWPIVVERKNVIYHLLSEKGHYILQ